MTMGSDVNEQIALHRFGVIAEAANEALTPAERGVIVRALAARCAPPSRSEAAALRLELPSRSAAQIASILFHCCRPESTSGRSSCCFRHRAIAHAGNAFPRERARLRVTARPI